MSLDYVHVRGSDVVIQPPSGGDAVVNGVVFTIGAEIQPTTVVTYAINHPDLASGTIYVVGNMDVQYDLSCSSYIWLTKKKIADSPKAATGNDYATAASLGASAYHTVTAADGTKGVKLPVADASIEGLIKTVYNDSGNDLILYPGPADAIYTAGVTGGAGVAVTIATQKHYTFYSYAAGFWRVISVY